MRWFSSELRVCSREEIAIPMDFRPSRSCGLPKPLMRARRRYAIQAGGQAVRDLGLDHNDDTLDGGEGPGHVEQTGTGHVVWQVRDESPWRGPIHAKVINPTDLRGVHGDDARKRSAVSLMRARNSLGQRRPGRVDFDGPARAPTSKSASVRGTEAGPTRRPRRLFDCQLKRRSLRHRARASCTLVLAQHLVGE